WQHREMEQFEEMAQSWVGFVGHSEAKAATSVPALGRVARSEQVGRQRSGELSKQRDESLCLRSGCLQTAGKTCSVPNSFGAARTNALSQSSSFGLGGRM